MYFSNISLTKN